MTQPEGYSTVSPYLAVAGAEQLLEWIEAVFGVTPRTRMTGAAGALHAEVELGDSLLMVGEAGADHAFRAMLHVYVDDADAAYERALAAGGTSTLEPHDTDFGDHRAAVTDPCGNEWWIATRTGSDSTDPPN